MKRDRDGEIEIDRQHFNVKIFQCMNLWFDGIFRITLQCHKNRTSFCICACSYNFDGVILILNEFIGVWQSSQWLQLNCHLNVKITNHSNTTKLKNSDSIAVVVTIHVDAAANAVLNDEMMNFYQVLFAQNRAFADLLPAGFPSITAILKYSINAYSWLNFIAINLLQSSLNCMHQFSVVYFIHFLFLYDFLFKFEHKRLIENHLKHLLHLLNRIHE